MDTQFIGVTESIGIRMITKHGIRLVIEDRASYKVTKHLIATTSTGEILNVVLRKQVETYYVIFSSSEGSKMQKHCDSSRIKNNDALREQMDSTLVETNMYKRSLFYWAKIYYSQLKKGQKYRELCPVIAINILDFNLFKDLCFM